MHRVRNIALGIGLVGVVSVAFLQSRAPDQHEAGDVSPLTAPVAVHQLVATPRTPETLSRPATGIGVPVRVAPEKPPVPESLRASRTGKSKPVKSNPAIATQPASSDPSEVALVERPVCPPPGEAATLAKSGKLDSACAIAYVNQLCGQGDADFTQKLAAYLGTQTVNVRKGLGRVNLLNTQSARSWCELSADGRAQALAIARTPKKVLDAEKAQANREYLMYTMSDADGTINAGGYSAAVAQRRLLLPETHSPGAKAAAVPSITQSRAAGGVPVMTVVPMAAGLPATPAGWTNLTGYAHPVGRINDLLIDNVGTITTRTMWAGTDGGGIWKTTDGGTVWTPVNDFNGSLAIGKILRSPRNSMEMYASTNPRGSHTYSPFGILKSSDGGLTWLQLASTNPVSNVDWQYVTHLAIHPAGVGGQDVLLAATYNGGNAGGVYQSTDSGVTWAKISANAVATHVGFHPADGNRRAYTLNDGTITLTTTGIWPGTTSTILAGTTSANSKFAFAPSDLNVMYALVSGSGGSSNLLRSATAGTSWAPLTPPTGFFYNSGYLSYTGGLWVDPGNSNRIVMMEALAASTANAPAANGTTGWTQSNSFWIDHHGAVADPGFNGTTNKIVYFMDDGGLYKFTDVDTPTNGVFLALGMTITEAYSAAGRGGNVVLGAQDVGARHYRTALGDSTQKWRLPSGPGIGDGAFTAADPTNPNILYGSNQYQRLSRTSDGGATTIEICQGIPDAQCTGSPGPLNSAFIAPFMLDPNTPTTMLAGTGSLWRSTNVSTGTPSWSAIQSGVGSVVVAIAVAKTDSNIIWTAYQNGAVYKTANGLAATPIWTQVSTVPAGNKLRIFIDPTNSSRVFLGFSGFTGTKLHFTTNDGTSWSPVPGLPSASVFAIAQHPANPAWLYAGTAVGLFASTDGGGTWGTSNEGPANVQIRDLSWYSELGNRADLLVATFGRGIWQAALQAGSGFQLAVNRNGNGTGTVTSSPAGINCGSGCANIFTANSTVTLTATPDQSSSFTGWTGANCSGTGTCTVSMSAAQAMTATFDLLPEVFPTNCAVPAGWTTPGIATTGWAVATDRKRSGSCSLKSNAMANAAVGGAANNNKAQIQVTGNFQAGTVSFFYNVNSEPLFDCLRFLVNGVQRAEMGVCTNTGGSGASGNITTWTQVSIALAAGPQTFVWSYEKDETVAPTGDAAWIDDVVLPPLAISSPGAPTIGSITPGAGQATIVFAAPVSNGGAPINSYTATCTAMGQPTRTATGPASPLRVIGLTGGVVYSCSVTATNSGGFTSVASGTVPVTPGRSSISPLLMLLLD